MPQLESTTYISQLFWLVLVFSLLYLLLSRVVLPPLLAVMQAREDKRKGDIARAQQLKEEAEHAREQYERVLADAQLRSQQVFSDAEASIKKKTDAMNMEMDQAMATKLAQAQQAIAVAKQELYNQIIADGTDLVARMVEKFTHTRPDDRKVSEALRSVKMS